MDMLVWCLMINAVLCGAKMTMANHTTSTVSTDSYSSNITQNISAIVTTASAPVPKLNVANHSGLWGLLALFAVLGLLPVLVYYYRKQIAEFCSRFADWMRRKAQRRDSFDPGNPTPRRPRRVLRITSQNGYGDPRIRDV